MLNQVEHVDGIVRGLLSGMGLGDFDVRIEPAATPEPWQVLIAMREGRFLIGKGGDNLKAFEHLLRVLVSRQLGAEAPLVVCDINNYRRERAEYLRSFARQVAQQVKLEQRPIQLRPMSAFERRVIHVELATRPDIMTESQGEGDARRVVVRPYTV
ncbi:hypothetical protein HYZ80_04010 [Candidatus Parcubacteria bacterium]|nr:hypothetical protein [Candidatus Parcubacteria bacterium]